MLFLVRMTVKVLVLFLDEIVCLVSSSIRLKRLYISLPVLHISAGHSLYIPFLLDTWPNTCLDVLKRTKRRHKGKRLFLDQYRLFLGQYLVLFLEGVVLFLVLFLDQCVSLYIVYLIFSSILYI